MIAKLVSLITLVAATSRDLFTSLGSARQKLADANAVIAQQAETIETLKRQHEQDELDDAALEKARDEAVAARDQSQTALDELTAQVSDATATVAKLADELNAQPETPVFQADLSPSTAVGGPLAVNTTFADAHAAAKAEAEAGSAEPETPPVVGGESDRAAPVPQVPTSTATPASDAPVETPPGAGNAPPPAE